MLGVKEVLGFSLISLAVTLTLSSAHVITDEKYDSAYNLPAYDPGIQYLIESKRAVTEFKKQLENEIRKRVTCFINGGLSGSCNNRDASDAMDKHRYLFSKNSPGRRRRRSIDFLSKDYE